MASVPPQNIQCPLGVPSLALASPLLPFGPNRTKIICPACRLPTSTSTSVTPKASAWLSCLLICIFGCWCGCCLIPCCLQSFNIVHHRCPNCDTYLGQYRS
ncbi:lipopolysaccharide-induced tumor necrosis factor-alpha factor [Aphis craccivora]|uniref:Lipopolysaccharide-induced tumor necrosis factor-alpha factor n=1 Tax=Aphis craccivora TaxID=307492 RepID=A0A6G0W3F2_APHCR|nr:lipopolysaccharide-induced tumor necrosis factor-alpha factor [Aphis craccivora]